MGTSYEMHRVLYTSPVQSRRCKIYVPGRYLGSDGAVDMHVVRKYSTIETYLAGGLSRHVRQVPQ